MGDEADALNEQMEMGSWPFLASLRRQLKHAFQHEPLKQAPHKVQKRKPKRVMITIKTKRKKS